MNESKDTEVSFETVGAAKWVAIAVCWLVVAAMAAGVVWLWKVVL